MTIDPETLAYLRSRDAEIQAAQDRLWEDQQTSMEQQRADVEGHLYTQLGFHEAGKEAENALMFAMEWQKTVNARSEAQANGDVPPPEMNSGMLFTDPPDTDRWEIMGDIFGGSGNNGDDNNGGTPGV